MHYLLHLPLHTLFDQIYKTILIIASCPGELILMSEPTERPDPSALSLLWKKETLVAMADNISPRLSRLVALLASLLTHSVTGMFSQEEQDNINEAFKALEYPKSTTTNSLCRVNDDTLKYYRCFTCELSRNSCLCERCFSDPKHANHEFKLMSGSCYCDCGNQQCLRKEYFCKEHQQREHKEASTLSKRQRELFIKQFQFLLTLGLLSKLSSEQPSIDKAEYISTKIIQLLTTICSGNSHTYQRMSGQLLLQTPKGQFKLFDPSSLLHQYFWIQWASQTFYKCFSKLLLQLYSYEPIRRRILIQYFTLHSSEIRKVVWVSPLTQIDAQYFLQGKSILKLIRTNTVQPLTLNYKFTSIDSTAGCFIQIYRAYRIMAETSSFTEILEESIRKINFATFYTFGIIDRESRAAVSIVTKHFLVFLKLIIKTLQKFTKKREAEVKIIQQSYQYIKTKEESFNFCPQRTLCWCLFSHLSCSVDQLALLPISDILALLGQTSLHAFYETLQRMLQSCFNLFRIQNYNDYRQMTSDGKYELNSANRILVSLDYTCLRIILTLLKMVFAEGVGRGHILAVRDCAVGRMCMLQKWVHLHRVEHIKRQSITEPQARAQVATLMQTGLFIKPEDQIAGTTIEVVAILNNLLFASQSTLCQLVLANVIGKANSDKVIEIYREFAWLHPGKTRLQLKNTIQAVIDDPKLIKNFTLSQHEGFFRGQRTYSYTSNLSYCTRFFNDQLTDDSTQRFIKKLSLPSPSSSSSSFSLSKLVFTEDVISQLIKYTKYFIRFICGSNIDLKEAAALSVTFNLLLQSIIVIFMETRINSLKQIFMQLNSNPVLNAAYTDYTKIIVQILMDHFDKANSVDIQEEKTVDRKEAARLKRGQKMKEMKEKQEKFLQEHNEKPQEKAKPAQDEQVCIICKQPSSAQRHLNYLCNMRYSNTFTRNILHTNQPMLVITTCGHMIHQNCLADSIDPQDEYGTNYRCFLCKQLSNLRAPLSLNDPQSYLQYLLTIMTLQLTSNPSLKDKQKQLTHLTKVAKMLYQSTVLSIFFYYFSVGKFYIACILPLVKNQVLLLKWIIAQKQIRLPHPQSNQHRLRIIEEKMHWTISNRPEQINTNDQSSKIDRQLIEQLFSKIFPILPTSSSLALREIKQIQKLKFFPLPKDLRNLTRQMGKCRGCQRYSNHTMICFLCGFKICTDCSAEMNVHIDGHLGTSVLIDVQTGRYSFRYRNIQVAFNSLYANYVGQEFVSEIQLPPEGEFQLSQQRVEKLIDEVLKDNVQSTVEEYVRAAEVAPACNVQ